MTSPVARQDAPRPTGRTLDDEGIPDLEGPLPEKELTGDPQEGVEPPADHPASFDYGVTAEEDERGEPLSVRLAHEVPDVVVDDEDDDALQLLDEESAFDEDDKDLVGEGVEPGLLGFSAEDAAVHVVDEAPGGVDGPDSYLDGLDPQDFDDDE
jgi:hypothetical protein